MTAAKRGTRPHPQPKAKPRNRQYGAMPWRNTRRWIIPKGWPIDGHTPAEAAAREAMEEAGVSGKMANQPLGTFSYKKLQKSGAETRCTVRVFTLKVARQRRKWPEKSAREWRWCSPDEAAVLVKERGLRRLITAFAQSRKGRPRKKLKRK
jgi:8-oxo-dGTP pyrophosphatase MutT (NUDIX family)